MISKIKPEALLLFYIECTYSSIH